MSKNAAAVGVQRAVIVISKLDGKARRVRTPGGAEHYGQPIGSVIRTDPISRAVGAAGRLASALPDADSGSEGYSALSRRRAQKVVSVAVVPDPDKPKRKELPPAVKGAKHLHQIESDYEGYECWVDSKNLKVYVAKEGSEWVALDSNDVVIATAKTKTALVKDVDKALEPRLRDDMRWATDADRKKLGIPPAWRSFCIAKDSKQALQGIGYDYKGDTQWKYSEEHRQNKDQVKFKREERLKKKIPALNRYLKSHMRDEDNDALMMLRVLGMRPDHGDGKGDVETFGATSLQAKHVHVSPTGLVTLNFTPGKRKTPVVIKMRNKMLADMLRERKKDRKGDTPLFDVSVDQVNKLFKSIVGDEFMLKDLRTLKANEIALESIAKRGNAVPKTKAEFVKWRREVAQDVSAILGNLPKQALDSYINPMVFQSWLVDPSWA